jgi:hypothetical protein
MTRLLLAGGVLALLAEVLPLASAPDDAGRTIVVDPERVAGAERAWVAVTGRAPAADERAALVAAEIDEEILYREALALGIDDGDAVVQQRIAGSLAFVEDEPPLAIGPDALATDLLRQDVVVRRRLVERMRARLERAALDAEPSESELAAALERDAERFRLPARVRIALAPALPADDAPTPSGVRELPAQSERDLARVHGAAFAREVFRVPAGAWSAPLAATSGRWRVLVREHEPPRLPPIADVRNQLRDLVRRERAAAAVRSALDELRRGYHVSVAPSAAPERRG